MIGIKNFLLDFIKNPFVIWFKWLMKKWFLEYRNNELFIGYMSQVDGCFFGKSNVIHEKCVLKNSELGDFSYISVGSTILNTRIGKFSSIGPGVRCGLGKHLNRDYVSTHPAFFTNGCKPVATFVEKNYFSFSEPIQIGNDVWIGANVVILDGIVVGDGAIIGAGAIVTKNIPAYAIVVGTPAVIKKYRFSQEEIVELLKLKWWDLDIEWLKNNTSLMRDFNCLIKAHKGGIF